MTAATATAPGRAACADTDGWDLAGLPRTVAADQAQFLKDEFCARCPIADGCLADATARGAYDTVRGGVQFGARGQVVGPTGDGLCRGGCGTAVAQVWCDGCRPKPNESARRVSPGRRAGPIDHGTTAGGAKHRRRGEKTCPACLAAERVYEAGRRADRKRQATAQAREAA